MKRSLRKNTMVKLSLLLSIPIIIGIVFSFVYLQSNIQNVLDRNDEIVRLVGFQVDHFLNHPKTEITQVKGVLDSKTEEADDKADDIALLMSQFEYLYRIEHVDNSGMIVETYPHSDTRIGLDVSRRQIFEKVTCCGEEYAFGDTYFDSEIGEVSTNVAIATDNGYLIGYINLNTLQSAIHEDVGGGMMMTVVDNRGTYMVHSDASLVSQRKVDPHYSEIVNGKTANRDIVDLSTKPYYVHFSEVPEINWYVIAYQDQREVVSELINTMIGIVVGLLVLFVILMVLIGIMFNTIDKAVKQLRDSAKKVAEGRYDIRLSETPHEEFKQLFENFELMAKRIDNRENEITVLTNTLEENYYHTIIALARAIEAKDNYTGNHCERVRDYSLILGQELGLDSQAIRQLRYGSILHDIGKMGVDEAILNKTERLTDEEFARIKEHSTMGYNIIQNIPHMKSAKDIILYHHERFDGKGYPQQLTGFQIPLLARIVAIADAFDAMTSVRPYRDQTMTTQQAVIELKTHSGTQFDSEMVKAFIRAVEKNPDALPGHA